jgi:sensor histidine kinase YesM
LNEGEWVEHGEEHEEGGKKEIAVKGERANSWLKISITDGGHLRGNKS